MRLPDGWQTKTLGDVCDISSSKRIYRSEYVAEGIPFYRGKEIIRKARNEQITETLYISFERYQEIRRKYEIPKPGDILLTSVGTLGVPYIVKNSDVFYFKDGNLTWFRDYRDAHNLFLYYWLISPKMRDQITASHIGVAQPALTIVGLKGFTINLPPLPTQRKIAAVLSAYDDLIENNARRIAVLEEMAQAIYREWFVRFRFPGHEQVAMVDSELGPIPEGWEIADLGDIADVRWGNTSITKKSYVEEGFDAYSASGLDGKLPRYEHDHRGVVLSAIGANCGRTWFAEGKWSCIKNTIRFWATSDSVSTGYLFFATMGKDYWPKRGAAQPFISQGDARRCPVLVPTDSLLKRFSNFAGNSLSQTRALRQTNSKLRQIRDLLLPRLVSGEVDVSDLTIDGG